MPLIHGKSDKSRSENIRELIKAGHDPKQAEAIAYKEQRKAKAKDDFVKRRIDKEIQEELNKGLSYKDAARKVYGKNREQAEGEDDTAEAWISRKIEQLIKEGYEPKQAQAIAYAEHRRNAKDDDTGKSFKIYSSDAASARNYDLNGWPEIKGNPISKVGVFDYLGRDISPDLESDRVYKVYRPKEELDNDETINSFRLLPWTIEHAMLGKTQDGLTAPEDKGIHGVIGEDVYFEDGYLKGNIKIFSQQLADVVDSGKKELSIGYRCLYEITPGVYDGIKYDAIQRQIRGNHLASVSEGRSGHDVAVLDHFRITLDAKEIKMPKDKKHAKDNMALKELLGDLEDLKHRVEEFMMHDGEEIEDENINEEEKNYEKEEGKEGEAMKELEKKTEEEGDAKDAEGEYKKFVNKAELEDEDMPEEEAMSQEDEDDKPGDMSKPKDGKGMDAKIRHLTREIRNLKSRGTKTMLREISQRDALAQRLSQHIGAFDHSCKTYDEVARYGVKKLGLRCVPGHEVSMIEGYLSAAKVSAPSQAMDSKPRAKGIEAYLKGAN